MVVRHPAGSRTADDEDARTRIGRRASRRTTFAAMYWNVAQQLAHATANGAVERAGDLFASGTICGRRRTRMEA